MDVQRRLTRQELTAALAARQGLIERARLDPAEAIRRLTPLQGQHPPAPFIALAARLDGFTREDLEAAISAGDVVKATINRQTLHLAAAADYPAYAQLTRQARLRSLRTQLPRLDQERVTAELTSWFQREPRTNAEIRERIGGYDGVPQDPNTPVLLTRTLLPLIQLPPAGHWADTRRATRFALAPQPLPDPADAAAHVLERYLAAFGPASRRDAAAWAGVAQRDFAWGRVETVTYVDEDGTELLDLPGAPLPPAGTPLPPRFLAHWDQPLLAYANRDRIMSLEVQALQLTLSGDPTVTVDGRVAASWGYRDDVLEITPRVELSRAQREAVQAEAVRTARFCGMKTVNWL